MNRAAPLTLTREEPVEPIRRRRELVARKVIACRPPGAALAAPAALAVAMGAFVLLVPPAGEFPVDVDWNYTRVVERLLNRGDLSVSPWTAASLVLQVGWGALFAQVFGISHTTLRCSTLVLAAATVFGFYALLRQVLDRPRALIGAFLLLFNPLFVALAYSFKSNVPFLALALWALVCDVRALRAAQPRLGLLLAGSAIAGAAFLVRQIAIALPLAVLLAWALAGGHRRPDRLRTLAAILGPFAVAVLLGVWLSRQRGPVFQEPTAWTFEFWRDEGPAIVLILISRAAAIVSTLGLFALPALVGARVIWRGAPAWQRGIVVVLLALLATGVLLPDRFHEALRLFPHFGDTLSSRGFYTPNRHDNGGTQPQSIVLPEGVLLAATAAGILGAGLLALVVVRSGWPATVSGPAAVPLLFGLLAFVFSAGYHSFYDDYILAILPSTLLVALLPARRGRWALGVAVAGVAILAGWSLWWERDYLEREAAVFRAGDFLISRGVPAEEIDGGFEWNGWHRGQAAINEAVAWAEGRSVGRAFQNRVFNNIRVRDPRWVLAYEPPQGRRAEVLATFPYGHGHLVFAVDRAARR